MAVKRSLRARPNATVLLGPQQHVSKSDIERIVKLVGVPLPPGDAMPEFPFASGALASRPPVLDDLLDDLDEFSAWVSTWVSTWGWGPRPEALRVRLDSAVRRWKFEESARRLPTPRELSSAFNKIDRLASKLLKILDPDGHGGLHAVFLELHRRAREDGGEVGFLGADGLDDFLARIRKTHEARSAAAKRLLDVVPRLRDLQRWSRMPQPKQRLLITSEPRIHEGKTPIDNLLRELMLAWTEVWERKPTFTVHLDARPVVYGPFFRFVHAVVDPLLVPKVLTDEAIRMRLRTLKGRPRRPRKRPVAPAKKISQKHL